MICSVVLVSPAVMEAAERSGPVITSLVLGTTGIILLILSADDTGLAGVMPYRYTLSCMTVVALALAICPLVFRYQPQTMFQGICGTLLLFISAGCYKLQGFKNKRVSYPAA